MSGTWLLSATQLFDLRSPRIKAIQGLVDALIAGMGVAPNHRLALMAGECLDGARLGAGLRHLGDGRMPQRMRGH